MQISNSAGALRSITIQLLDGVAFLSKYSDSQILVTSESKIESSARLDNVRFHLFKPNTLPASQCVSFKNHCSTVKFQTAEGNADKRELAHTHEAIIGSKVEVLQQRPSP